MKRNLIAKLFIAVYFFLGFIIHAINELVHSRNPYLDGYSDVYWGRIESPFFSVGHMTEVLLLQVMLGLAVSIFGVILAHVYLYQKSTILKFLALSSGVIFSLVYFLENSGLVNKNSSYGAGHSTDFVIGLGSFVFSVFIAVHFLRFATECKRSGKSKWKYILSLLSSFITFLIFFAFSGVWIYIILLLGYGHI